jgi:hypothetical protein
MKLNDVYNIVNYIARKNISGNTFTINQFNDILKYAPLEFVRNNISRYESSTSSSALFSYYRSSTLAYNNIEKPSDYWRLSSLKYITPSYRNKVSVMSFKSITAKYDGTIYLNRVKGEIFKIEVFTEYDPIDGTVKIPASSYTLKASMYSGSCSITGLSSSAAYDIYVYYKNYADAIETRFVDLITGTTTFGSDDTATITIPIDENSNIEICGIELSNENYDNVVIKLNDNIITLTNTGSEDANQFIYKILFLTTKINKVPTEEHPEPVNTYKSLLVFDRNNSNTGFIKYADCVLNNMQYSIQFDNGGNDMISNKYQSEQPIELLTDAQIGNGRDSLVSYRNIKCKEDSTSFSVIPNDLSYPIKLTYLRSQTIPFADYVILDTEELLILEEGSILTRVVGEDDIYTYSKGIGIGSIVYGNITLIAGHGLGAEKTSTTKELDMPEDFVYDIISLILNKIGISLQRQDISQYAELNTKVDE